MKKEKEENRKNIFRFQSKRKVSDEVCFCCKGSVSSNGIRKVRLTDVPLILGEPIIMKRNNDDQNALLKGGIHRNFEEPIYFV